MPAAVLSVAVLAGATAVVAWPWAVDAGLTFPQRDTAFNLVALVHLQDVVLRGADWRASPLGWPLADSVALTDWMAGQAVMGLPLRLLGVGPTRMHDLLVLVGLFLSAWAAHRLAQAMTGRGPHTWLAGVIGGLGPVQLLHAQHVNLVHHEGVIGGALLFGAGLHGRRPGMAAVGALLLGAAGQLGAYLGMQGAVVGLVVGATLAGGSDRRTLAAALGGGVAGLATMAPIAAVYRSFQALHEVRLTAGELGQESWDPAWTLYPVAYDLLSGAG